jgi:hypothetical protein
MADRAAAKYVPAGVGVQVKPPIKIGMPYRVPQRVQSDRRRQLRALRRGLESTLRNALIAWLAHFCCEHVRIRLPIGPALSRPALCLLREGLFQRQGRAVHGA